MRPSRLAPGLAAFGLLGLAITLGASLTCGDRIGSPRSGVALTVRAQALGSRYDLTLLTVTAQDMDTLATEMTAVDGSWIAAIEVPLGSARRFQIDVQEGGRTVYSGATVRDVPPAGVDVDIVMQPAVPMLYLSPHQMRVDVDSTMIWFTAYGYQLPAFSELSSSIYINYDGPGALGDAVPPPGLDPLFSFDSEGSWFEIFCDGQACSTYLAEHPLLPLASFQVTTFDDWSELYPLIIEWKSPWMLDLGGMPIDTDALFLDIAAIDVYRTQLREASYANDGGLAGMALAAYGNESLGVVGMSGGAGSEGLFFARATRYGAVETIRYQDYYVSWARGRADAIVSLGYLGWVFAGTTWEGGTTRPHLARVSYYAGSPTWTYAPDIGLLTDSRTDVACRGQQRLYFLFSEARVAGGWGIRVQALEPLTGAFIWEAMPFSLGGEEFGEAICVRDQQDAQGYRYAYTGRYRLANEPDFDLFCLTALDEGELSGAHQGALVNRPGDQSGRDIIALTGGGFAVAGYSESEFGSNRAALLARFSEEGEFLWSSTFGGIDTSEDAYAIVESPSGGLCLVGEVRSSDDDDTDVLVYWMSADGTGVWRQTYGDDWDDGGRGAVINEVGDLVIVGYRTSGVTLERELYLLAP